ncbi:MAG: VTT domain-containing protein [Desulfobacterales bacterium]
MKTILEKGKNCWRMERTDKLRFIIDASDYFYFLRETLKNARSSVYVLSWDIDSRIRLVRNGAHDGSPERLGDFLNFLAKTRPDLNIYILNWDSVLLYKLDREILPIFKLGWKTHKRVHFCLDNYHPEGASQHQKIVVVDQNIAFIGGLDLTKGRWDTSDHIPDNQKRDRVEKKISRPYHDVQVMLSGGSAKALAELVRDRWQKVTGKKLPIPDTESTEDPWPEHIIPDMKNVIVGLARTQGAYKRQTEIREIQAFYTEAIQSAKNFVYIENQYFTAPIIGDAIQAVLEQQIGPEIVMVMPRNTEGWLSQHTMDILRVRLIRRLKKHDHHSRLRVFYPEGPGLEFAPINVHAKLMIVDDRIVTVGSANLNNRSMGLDNECNVIIEAVSDKSLKNRIAVFRSRLLAEHLGRKPEEVYETIRGENSLICCIRKLNKTNQRYLEKLPLDLPEDANRLLPETEVVDPEHPIRPELMIRHIVPEEQEKPARFRIVIWIMLIGFMGFLSAMWRWTPLGEWLNADTLTNAIGIIRDMPAAPIWVILVFVITGFVAFPFTLLIIATVIVFGYIPGFFYSLIGGMLSAVAVYWVGELLGRNTIRKLTGSKLNKISRKIAKHGIINIIFVRIIPVAPFTIINLVAGASHINFRDYLLGTLIGMAPGMMVVAIIADRIRATVQDPVIYNAVWLIITVAVASFAAYLLASWLRRKSDKAVIQNKQDD